MRHAVAEASREWERLAAELHAVVWRHADVIEPEDFDSAESGTG